MKIPQDLFATVLALLTCASASAQTAIKVEVETPSNQGQLILSLCTKETFLKENCPVQRVVSITVPVTTAELTPPGPGTYAVFVAHDLNGNGKLDKSFLGMPTEPVGLSRNPGRPRFGPPKFEDSSFEFPSTGRLEPRIKLLQPD